MVTVSNGVVEGSGPALCRWRG